MSNSRYYLQFYSSAKLNIIFQSDRDKMKNFSKNSLFLT